MKTQTVQEIQEDPVASAAAKEVLAEFKLKTLGHGQHFISTFDKKEHVLLTVRCWNCRKRQLHVDRLPRRGIFCNGQCREEFERELGIRPLYPSLSGDPTVFRERVTWLAEHPGYSPIKLTRVFEE